MVSNFSKRQTSEQDAHFILRNHEIKVTEKTLYQIKITWEIVFEQKMQPIKKGRNTASRENGERYSLEKLKRVKENSPFASHVFLTSHKGLWIHEKIKLEFCIFDSCSAPWILKS